MGKDKNLEADTLKLQMSSNIVKGAVAKTQGEDIKNGLGIKLIGAGFGWSTFLRF